VKSFLRAVIERLRQKVLITPQHIFNAGTKRRPALKAHRNVASVLKALSDESENTYPAREALMRALIAEHRKSGEALWSSMLLVAFYPALRRLRSRLVSDTVPGYELDQLVVTSFLASLTELPFTDRTDRVAMRLRQRTQRQVFAFLRRERKQRYLSIELDEQPEIDRFAPRRSNSD
jgi:hypothetical protein